MQMTVNVQGHANTERKVISDSRFVSDGYFATMRIPVLAGEGCPESLNFRAAVVNRSFTEKYLNGLAAIGRRLQLISTFSFPTVQIRGIVADVREQGLNHEPEPTVYWCLNAPDPSPYFLIRTQGAPLAMADTLRRKIHAIDPARSVFDVSPLEQHLSDSFAENRLRTILLALFAATAVSLACIGLYGTLSYFVTTRKREVGLRLALGALPGQVVRRFLLKGLAVSFFGCVAGLCLAMAFSRVLAGMLYGVSAADAETFFSVIFLALAVAALACLLPALRAARVDPMQVLREE
jgi:putative ABC transport system permease protein